MISSSFSRSYFVPRSGRPNFRSVFGDLVGKWRHCTRRTGAERLSPLDVAGNFTARRAYRLSQSLTRFSSGTNAAKVSYRRVAVGGPPRRRRLWARRSSALPAEPRARAGSARFEWSQCRSAANVLLYCLIPSGHLGTVEGDKPFHTMIAGRAGNCRIQSWITRGRAGRSRRADVSGVLAPFRPSRK